MFARDTWKVVASIHVTNRLLLACFGMDLLPFQVDTVFALGSALKWLKYRSANMSRQSSASDANCQAVMWQRDRRSCTFQGG